MNQDSMKIGFLSLSAVLLLTAVLVVGSVQTKPAYGGMIDRVARFALVTGQLNDDVDMVYVLDSQTDQLLAYRLMPDKGMVILADKKSFGGGDAPEKDRQNMKP